MGIQEWSASDIKKARSYFLNGFTIKAIAQELGRTPTAINKALSRFGIRYKKPRRHYAAMPLQPKEEVILITPSFERKALRKELENWVSFWRVCEYLSEQNVCIYEVSAANTELERRQFRVDTQILGARQLLMLANKMRAHNHLKAFFVKGLSW
jgi:IS30 family transposase